MSIILLIIGWLFIGYISVILANKIILYEKGNDIPLSGCIFITIAGVFSFTALIIVAIVDDYPLKDAIKNKIYRIYFFIKKALYKIYFLKDEENKQGGKEKGLECDQICRPK